MSLDNTWDGLQFDSLDFPYNRIKRELSEDPRLVRGKNMFVTLGGKLSKRPGTLAVANSKINGRVDRLWLYETLESPPKVYIMASIYNAASLDWAMYYLRLDAGAPAWTTLGTTRDLNASAAAHEAVAARGLFFIKGFPKTGSSEKLGTAQFDGSGAAPTVSLWGLLGPTAPVAISGVAPRITAAITAAATSMTLTSTTGLPGTPFDMQLDYELVTVTGLAGPVATITRGVSGTVAATHIAQTIALYRDWTASAHPVTVNLYWKYAYAYKTRTGQISNRSPLETNPDKLPSLTGPFINLIPKFTVTGHADTTNVTKIVIYRVTDGGGTFFKLKEITNTGAGPITVYDTDLGSGPTGTTLADPLPDEDLSANDFGPSLTSNSPPPTVLSPLITGTDNVARSTPLAYYQSRVFYAIGNVLFYSAQEELPDGIPEEAFPSGVKGNFFRFQHPIVNLESTTEGLYIITLQDTSVLMGENKETFNVQPLFNSVGAPAGHPRAVSKFEDAVIFLTHDYRVVMVRKDSLTVLSDPLFTDIVDAVNLGAEIDVKYWADLDKQWLVVTGIRKDLPSSTAQWVYDIKKSQITKEPFWFVPWNIPAVAVASGRMNESSNQRRLLFFLWNNTVDSQLVRLDSTVRTGTDDLPGAAGTLMDMNFVTNLFQVPAGNHVNSLRRPGIVPGVYNFQVERTKFVNDENPRTYWFKDDLWTDPIATRPLPEDPARLEGPNKTKGYVTMVFPVNQVAHRFAVQVVKNQSSDLFEVQGLSVVWVPDSGSGI